MDPLYAGFPIISINFNTYPMCPINALFTFKFLSAWLTFNATVWNEHGDHLVNLIYNEQLPA